MHADEFSRLERGDDTAPPVAHTRDHASRSERPGAPRWQLVDFAEHVTAADRAGLEAALESASILDALPAGCEPIGTFAARVTDDGAHALDDHRPLATLVLGLVRAPA